MVTSEKVSFLSSITTKVTVVLMMSFAVVIAIVFYVVSNEGYGKIKDESSKLAIETGKLTVSYISSDLKHIKSDAEQIRDTSEVLPLQQNLFHQSLTNIVTKHDTKVVDAGVFPSTSFQPYFHPVQYAQNTQTNKHSTKANDHDIASIDNAMFDLIESSEPQNCLWTHSLMEGMSQKNLIGCSMPIYRDSQFWGLATVNADSNVVQETLNQLNDELDESYAIVFDNSNQIIATSNKRRLPSIHPETGKALKLTDVLSENPAWEPLTKKINDNRQNVIAAIKPQIFSSVLKQLESMNQSLGAQQGSMILDYAANQKVSQSDIFDDSYVTNVKLIEDSYFQADSFAYLFTIPETNWHLVIVQSDSQTSSVAELLSKNIMKYVMFALLALLAIIFFMIDFLALRPMEETAQKILEADDLIDKNQYNRLSSIQFPKISNDEMGIVNGSLKKLLHRIEDNEGKLANINQELEIKVEERTSELKDAMQELKASQVQLIRSEKMATLGQMVAGVAHEVNTPLTYVQNNVEIIGQLAEQYEELVEMVNELKTAMTDEETPEEEIENLMAEIMELSDELVEDEISSELKDLIKDSLFGVEQITEMVLNLRNFARVDESKVKKVDLRECVATSLKIAQNAIKHHQINTNLQDIPEIECSPSQINQVVINLLNNAAQAIGDKPDGKIDIRTSATDQYVLIDIKDNGIGMSEEVLSKIFEPFFTTKGAGEGTGLGMAISQQIMEQHNGEIKVKSKPGVGTMFRLIFPIHNTIHHDAA